MGEGTESCLRQFLPDRLGRKRLRGSLLPINADEPKREELEIPLERSLFLFRHHVFVFGLVGRLDCS